MIGNCRLSPRQLVGQKGDGEMLKIAGVLLLVAGIAGLALGGFEYTQTREVAKLGPLDVKAKEQKAVTIPPLASGAVLALGAGLIVAGRKRN